MVENISTKLFSSKSQEKTKIMKEIADIKKVDLSGIR
jgi:hypothetical protein